MTLATAPMALPTALVSRPTEPSSCWPRLADWPLGHESQRGGEGEQALELFGHHQPQRLELGGDGGSGKPGHPAEEPEPEKNYQQQPPAARDRQDPADQPDPAVEEYREYRAADDQQQRLREDDQADNEQGHAEPHGGLGDLAADERVAEFRRAGPFEMGLGGRRRLRHQLFLSDFPARPERNAFSHVSGLYQTVGAVEREGDELGAAADILPRHRTAEAALPFADAAVGGIVAVVAHQPEVAGRDRDRSEIIFERSAKLDSLVRAAAGQGLADDRHPAVHLSVGAPDPIIVERRVVLGAARRIGVDRDHGGGLRLALHHLAVDDQGPVDHLHAVSGKADDPLDIIGAGAGRSDDDDVAALGQLAQQPALPVREDVEAGRYPRPAVRIFGHHQAVAGEQARHHRFGRDVEGLGDEAVEGEHGEQHPQQPLDLAPDGGALVFLLLGGRNCRRFGARLGNHIAQHSGLQLAGGEDNEGLRPGVIVGHGQMYVDGVAIRRKGVKPRLGAAAEL